MDARKELYIDGVPVDLPVKAKGASLNFGALNIAALSERKGDSSFAIEIPKTKTNRSVFKDLFTDYDSGPSSFDFKNWHLAEWRSDGLVYKYMLCRLDNVGDTYSLFFRSGNSDWFDIIRDRRLQSLNLVDQDHNPHVGTVQADSWQDFFDDDGVDYYYGLVDYGAFTGRNATATTEKSEIFPGMGMRRLIRQIFQEAGYSIAGGWKDTGIFKRCYHQFTNQRPSHLPRWMEANKLRVGMTADQTIITFPSTVELNDNSGSGFYDPAGSWNTSTFEWTPQPMRGRVILDLTLTRSGAFETYTVNLMGSVGLVSVLGTISMVSTTETVRFDTIENFSGPGNNYWIEIDNGINSVTVEDNSTLQIIPTDTWLYGSDVEMEGWLPDISQGDYINSVFNDFNVFPVADVKTKVVYLYSESEYFRPVSEAVDWSEKINLLVEPKLTPMNPDYPKIVSLEAAEDSQIVNFKEPDHFNNRYYFDTGNGIDTGSKKINNTEFRSTFMGHGYQNSGGHVLLPRMVGNDAQTFVWKAYGPHILIAYGLMDIFVISDKTYTGWNYSGSLRTTLPWSYFCKPEFIDAGALGDAANNFPFNLSFNKGQFEFGLGLAETNWPYTLNLIKEGKILEVEAYLDEIDIASLDPRLPIFIRQFNSYFRLNEITGYNPIESETCKVSLTSTTK